MACAADSNQISTMLMSEVEFSVFDGWSEPRCLVSFGEDGKIQTEPSTLEQLQLITDPTVIVTIVGPYRTGKSYLMNRLARSRNARGFSVGSTVQAHTKGIWIWCIHHPTRPGHSFILLDTEGLGDVEKVSDDDDIHIFTLAILLSSSLVYNCMNAINKTAIDGLHLASQAAELINTESRDDDVDAYFPSFVLVVRDMELELEVNGREVTEDEYLEHALKLKPGAGKTVAGFNAPRQCIRDHFTSRKCFTFKKPVRDSELLKRLNDLDDDELTAEFVRKREEFLSHILTHSPVKSINSQRVTGRALASLTASYVESIAGGKICIESTVQQMQREEVRKATDESLQLYQQLMQLKVPHLPTDTEDELETAHQYAAQQATELFSNRCVTDCDSRHLTNLQEILDAQHSEECEENETRSTERCEQLLKQLYQDIEKKTNDRYLCAGGYSDYLEDMEQLKIQYDKERHKGIMADAVFEKFMATQLEMSERLWQADMQMTADLTKVNDEIDRKEEAEREERKLEKSRRKTEKQLEKMRREFEEQIERMKEEHEKNMREADEEQRRQLENRMASRRREMEEELERSMQPLRNEYQRIVSETSRQAAQREIQRLERQQSYERKMAEFNRELGDLRTQLDSERSRRF